jgi:hypothetical protein
MSGIAIPAPSRYYDYFLKSIYNLRVNIGYMDPIEIWEIGDELTNEMRDRLALFPNIVFKNTTDYDDRIEHWRGFQAKAPVIKHSKLNDIIICDADVTLFQDPSVIQKSAAYIETGSFMFLDFPYYYFDLPREKHGDQIHISKFNSHTYYDKRRSFVKKICPDPPSFFPIEWKHLYDDSYPTSLAPEGLVEAGVFYVNREKHSDVIDTFYEFNCDWKESYECVHGDKEITWLSFMRHHKKVTFNNAHPVSYKGLICQIYNNYPFYIQKYDVKDT